MKKKIKIFFLLFPFIVFILHSLFGAFQCHQVDKLLFELDAIHWQLNQLSLFVRDNITFEGELVFHRIKIVDTEGNSIYQDELKIDKDMFGGGFVKGMQIDDDKELEILFWSHYGDKFYLDISEKKIVRKKIDGVTESIKNAVKKWHQYNVIHNYEQIILFVVSLVYYMILVSIYFILKLIRVFKDEKQ